MRNLRTGASVAALLLFLPSFAAAQSLTALPGLVSNGTPPTGFVVQNFQHYCTAGNALCWAQVQLFDGTTRATINANGGLNTNILSGSVTVTNNSVNPVFTTPSNASPTLVNWASAGPVTVLGQINAAASVPVTISTATTTQIVALIAGQSIYVTSALFIVGASDTITFKYGTGTNCGTGTGSLTGPLPLTTSAPFVGTLQLFVPVGNALCITTSAATTLGGSVAFVQQ